LAGLYIHIPFCKQKCYYCDFHFSTNRSYQEEMVKALCNEMELRQDYLRGVPIDTIYFGGGTPSTLERFQMERLLDKSYKLWNISQDPEITLEANPDDLSERKLKELKQVGINRLSVGIQSFNDDILGFLNRAHNAEEAKNCIKNARRIGFNNISVDLIFSIPGFSDDHLKLDLESCLALKPEHISAYSLTIEERTVFGNWQAKGKFKQVSDVESARQFEYFISSLESNGYEQYEVSNFCRDQNYSRHNSSYWKDVYYLGIGPGAHSYNGESRQSNVKNNPAYLKAISQHKVPAELELLDKTNKVNEYLLTSLRTKWGCDLKKLLDEWDYDLFEQQQTIIGQFIEAEYMFLDEEVLYLTRKGMMLADEIIGQLFLDSS